MKKLIAMLLSAVLVLGLMAGCTGDTVVVYDCTCCGDATEGTVADNTESKDDGALKTGLAVVTHVEAGNASEENDGKAEFDVTLVAVLVDGKGVIADCIIDSIGQTVTFDTTGAFTSDLSAQVLTKNELGDSYGMVVNGGAKHEWYEQADALARYCVGKTVEQVAAGYSDDADLATSASIYLGGYVEAIAAAVENAKVLGAEPGDELKLASINSLASSVEGTAQLDCNAVAMTLNEGVITSCYLDAVQATAAVDKNGAAAPGNIASKNELGDAYGMVEHGDAAYEWYRQAENFAAYVTGKVVAEVGAIAVDESTKPEDGTDLATSVTIAIGGFQALIEKAAK